jgi:LmbE family N-acetylglucosaminyl deacetylase
MGPLRLFLRAIAAVAICIAAVLASGVASASAAEGCTSSAMYFAAHEDDTLLFQSPSLLQDIQSEHCIRTVFLTAGDAGKTQSYWTGREGGAEEAYAQMAGVTNQWTHSTTTVNGRSIRLATLTAKPSISILFMRLPDGAIEGEGWPADGNQSLSKLWNSGNPDEEGPEISTIKALDNSATYDYEGLFETLAAMMQSFEPQQVYTQNFTVGMIGPDHADHVATGYFTRIASHLYTLPHRLVGFQDYETSTKTANVSGTLLGGKSAAFYKYGASDSDACTSEAKCTGTSYAAWLLRQYTVNPKETTGVVANAGFMQLSEVGTQVTLDGSASSTSSGKTLTYQWTQTGGPAVTLSSSTAVKPTFTTPSHPTRLTFSLTVKDGSTTSKADTVFVKVPSSDPTPTAVAGSAQTVASGAKVTLDGSESWDPNSVSLQYSWLQTGGPAVTLTGSSTAKPTFTAPTGPATLKFSLMVSNGNQTSAPSNVLITVKGIAPTFTSAEAAPFKTGVAGSFKVVTSGSPAATLTKEGELPPGLAYTDNGDGSTTISGTPTNAAAPPASSQQYQLKFKATNSEGSANQTLVLTVSNPGTVPAFTTGTSASFTTGSAELFTASASGEPSPVLSLAAGTLPAGVSFNGGTGSATLSGTPEASAAEPGQTRNYPLTLKAKSGAGEVTQSLTLKVTNPGTAPTITSEPTASFTTGSSGSFTITTTGAPAPTLTKVAGALPSGLSFTDLGSGSAKVSGTPGAAAAPPGESREYEIEVEATNVAGNVKQKLKLKVTNPGTPPAFTSGTSASFTTGTAGSFAITTSGAPTAAITLKSGTLPAGLKLTDNANGTGTISGTPEAAAAPPGETQTYNVELLAKSLAGEKPQTLTLSVKNPGTPPSFGSATTAAFTTGVAGSFKVETAGNPTAALSVSGTLPANLKLTDNNDGTATLSGTATAAAAEPGKSQSYSLTFKAKSAAGEKTQTFTLTVKNPGTPPTFSSAPTTTFVVGVAKTFTVQTASNPVASLTRTGALPTGLSFTDNGDGTATISGTAGAATAPPAGKQDYPLTLEADALSGEETQAFTLSVTNPGTPPAFTSGTSASFTTGTAGSFAITTSGAPTAAITLKSGTLPAGLKLTDNANGTGTISGTPEAAAAPPGETQTYNVELLAKSLAGEKPQTLTLSVKNPGTPPSFGSATTAAFTTGVAGSFKVETAGNPTAALSVSGTLPANLKLTDNNDGTATLSGTATAAAAEPGKSQSYSLTFKAKSAAGEKTQTFTLTVKNPGTPPTFSSAPTTTFVVGVAKTFTVQTASNPVASLTRTGALPTGLSFTDNGDGTATISGTAGAATAPPAGKQDYPLTLEADALSGEETQAFTLSVTNPGTPPSFGPGTTGSFTTGVGGSFKVTTTGAPTAALTISAGTLPEWLSFTDNGDGSATFAGTPPASAAPPASSKNFNFTVKAKSGAGEKTQSITLTVTNPGNAPTIASATSTAFTTGSAGSFEIVSTGSPAPTVAVTGELPPGLKFTETGNGRGTISGTPTNPAAPPASTKNWPVTISAVSTAGKATQTFTVIVTNPGVKPAFTSVASTSFTTGSAGSFTVSSSGSPNAALTVTEGELPTGVKLTDSGDGTATLAGTAAGSAAPPASSKPYVFTIRAKSGAGEVTQSFTLTVTNPGVKPAFTTATSAPFTTGSAGSFTISASGSPTAALSRIEGELPEGLSFSDKGNGSATIAGTPAASAAPAAGSQAYPLTIKATNGAGSATQSLTLTVTNPGVKPQITSATSTSFTTGTAGSFKVVSSGDPTAALTVSGELPTGVEFTDNGNGNGMISGTAAASAAPAGSSRAYSVTIKATNGAGSVSQPFTLTVVNPGTGPSITSAASTSFETGVAGSFEVKSTGNPTPSLSATGTLPPGVHFTDKGNGTGTISGTPEASAAPPGESHDYTFTIKATSGIGNVPQAFTLTVVNPGVDPSITSVASATFTTGVAGSFLVTTGGDPVPALSKTGGLPDGLSFAVNGDGTATIAGTPDQSAADPGQSRIYTLTLKAKSAAGEDTQPFTLTVENPGVKPAITSDPSVSFTTGVEKTFTISSSGNPVAALVKSGNLPSGLTFTDNGDGSAKISGTAAAAAAAPGTSQNYLLTLEASSAAGSTTQPFTLTVINPEQPTVNTPDTPPQPQPPVVIPPTNPLPPEPPVRVSLSQAKVLLPIGRYARRVVQVTAPSLASVTCKGKLPKGARCRVMAPGKVVVEGSKAVKRTGTFRLTIHVADADGANVRRSLIVEMLKPDDPALRIARP